MKVNVAEFHGLVSVENFWVDRSGVRWCFLFINGHPWLANEEDA